MSEESLIPGLGRSPRGRNGNSLQYSHQENSMNRGYWRVRANGVAKSWTWLNVWACTHTYSTGNSTEYSAMTCMGKDAKKSGYMCMYHWFTSLYTWNWHNMANQLYFNKHFFKKTEHTHTHTHIIKGPPVPAHTPYVVLAPPLLSHLRIWIHRLSILSPQPASQRPIPSFPYHLSICSLMNSNGILFFFSPPQILRTSRDYIQVSIWFKISQSKASLRMASKMYHYLEPQKT